MRDFDRNRELIKKMLSGSLTRREKRDLLGIIHTPAFDALLQEVLDEQGGDLLPQNDAVSLQAYARLKEFRRIIDNGDEKVVAADVRISPWKKYRWYVAATLLIIICSTIWILNPGDRIDTDAPALAKTKVFKADQVITATLLPEIKYKEYYNAKRTRQLVRLADGSTVTLGYKTRLRYPEKFEAAKRDVFLEGEAFFEVARDAKRPFTVISGKVHTKVLGTSFKVVTRKNDVEVMVVTGKVSVNYLNADSVLSSLAVMLPGDKVRWRNHHVTLSKIDTREVLGWKNGQLIFNKQSLQNILTAFCKNHSIKVDFLNKGFAEEKLSISLDENTSVQKALNILSASTGFEYTIDSVNGRPVKIIIK